MGKESRSVKEYMMAEEHEVATVKFQKYSFWTVIKIGGALWIITWIMNAGAYLTVLMNHAMAKGVGLATDVLEICASCWDSIG